MSTNPTKLVGYHLWLSTQYRQKSLNRLLKDFDLTHAQYMIMQYLSWADAKNKLADLSQNKIAKAMSLDPMMISNVLKLLEQKGYITKTKSTSGSISNTLCLSKIGSDIIKKAHDVVVQLEKNMFDEVGDKKFKKCLKSVAETTK